MFELMINTSFGAAHRIVNYPGKCDFLHGHNWKVEICVSGNKLDELGMLVDFKFLKKRTNEIIDTLDHHYLNELLPFKEINPSAENIAKYIFEELAKDEMLKDKCKIKYVKIWETENSSALYKEE